MSYDNFMFSLKKFEMKIILVHYRETSSSNLRNYVDHSFMIITEDFERFKGVIESLPMINWIEKRFLCFNYLTRSPHISIVVNDRIIISHHKSYNNIKAIIG